MEKGKRESGRSSSEFVRQKLINIDVHFNVAVGDKKRQRMLALSLEYLFNYQAVVTESLKRLATRPPPPVSGRLYQFLNAGVVLAFAANSNDVGIRRISIFSIQRILDGTVPAVMA